MFNPKTQKMLALGVLGPGGKASLEVPDSLMGRYQVVDISLERDDGDPGHSATSGCGRSTPESASTRASRLDPEHQAP